MILIYFENRKIINYFDIQKKSNDKLFFDILSQIKYNHLHTDVVLYWDTEKDFWNTLQQHTQLIEAAGGIVQNDTQEILMIHRNQHWDLPKGKREHHENLVENAKREIEEETQVKKLTYLSDLDITYHLYYIENTCVLKKTYWYVFQSSHREIIKPQIEEGITEVKWVSIKIITQYRNTMFLLIRELVDKYLQLAH